MMEVPCRVRTSSVSTLTETRGESRKPMLRHEGTKLDTPAPRALERSSGRRSRLAVRWFFLVLAVACVVGWTAGTGRHPCFPRQQPVGGGRVALGHANVGRVGAAGTARARSGPGSTPLVLPLRLSHRPLGRVCGLGATFGSAGVAVPRRTLDRRRYTGGGVLRLSLLLWLDPLAIFTGFVGGWMGTTERAPRLWQPCPQSCC